MDRRFFLRGLASIAALPLVAKFVPAPIAARIARAGAWAEVTIVSGAITEITIVGTGADYGASPFVVISSQPEPKA